MAMNAHSAATWVSEADESVELLNCFKGQSQDCLEAQHWNKSYLNSSISNTKGQTDEITIFFFF